MEAKSAACDAKGTFALLCSSSYLGIKRLHLKQLTPCESLGIAQPNCQLRTKLIKMKLLGPALEQGWRLTWWLLTITRTYKRITRTSWYCLQQAQDTGGRHWDDSKATKVAWVRASPDFPQWIYPAESCPLNRLNRFKQHIQNAQGSSQSALSTPPVGLLWQHQAMTSENRVPVLPPCLGLEHVSWGPAKIDHAWTWYEHDMNMIIMIWDHIMPYLCQVHRVYQRDRFGFSEPRR